MKSLRSEVEVEASPSRVWEILTDFASYPEWNPFITKIAGELREGSRLEVRMAPPGGRPVTFRPTILAVTRERELSWLGHLFVPGVFDGHHRFLLDPISDRSVRVRQEEDFRGILVPLMGSIFRKTEQGFAEMNLGLKKRAEGAAM